MKKKPSEGFGYVVAIDLGTSGTGVAFSSTKNKRIHSVDFSESSPRSKTPTSIYIKKSSSKDIMKEKVLFGSDAVNFFLNHSTAQNSYFFQRFKMCLFNPRSIMIQTNDGKEMSVVDVFSKALLYFTQRIPRIMENMNLDQIVSSKNRRKQEIRISDIRWVFCIPAILSNHAKHIIRQAAERVGIGRNCFLVLEPECASVFIEESYIRKLSPNSKKKNNKLPLYMVVDCGGGTVDITLQEVLPNHALRNKIPPRGGPWGSTLVDKEMIIFLEEVLKWEDQGGEIPAEARFGLLKNWEDVKCRKLFKDSSTLRKGSFVSLPIGAVLPFFSTHQIEKCCLRYNEEFNNNRIGSFSKSMEVVKYKSSGACLVISIDHIVRKWFEKPIQRICEEVQSIMRNFESINRDINYVFLVGGFSNCALLQNSMKNAVGGSKQKSKPELLVPSDPGQCVLHGAVILGLYPSRILSRISSVTYGIGIVTAFKEGFHPREKLWVSPDGRSLCREVFCTYVRKGDEIDVGHVIKKFVVPSREDQSILSLTIYESEKRDVLFTSDKFVRKLQTIDVEDPNVHIPKKMRKICIEMKFGAEWVVVKARNLITREDMNFKIRFHWQFQKKNNSKINLQRKKN